MEHKGQSNGKLSDEKAPQRKGGSNLHLTGGRQWTFLGTF